MYRYFLSYSHICNGCVGFGSTEVQVDKKITHIGDIFAVTKMIEMRMGVKDVVVINYILLDD